MVQFFIVLSISLSVSLPSSGMKSLFEGQTADQLSSLMHRSAGIVGSMLSPTSDCIQAEDEDSCVSIGGCGWEGFQTYDWDSNCNYYIDEATCEDQGCGWIEDTHTDGYGNEAIWSYCASVDYACTFVGCVSYLEEGGCNDNELCQWVDESDQGSSTMNDGYCHVIDVACEEIDTQDDCIWIFLENEDEGPSEACAWYNDQCLSLLDDECYPLDQGSCEQNESCLLILTGPDEGTCLNYDLTGSALDSICEDIPEQYCQFGVNDQDNCFFNIETQSCENLFWDYISSPCYGTDQESCTNTSGCFGEYEFEALMGESCGQDFYYYGDYDDYTCYDENVLATIYNSMCDDYADEYSCLSSNEEAYCFWVDNLSGCESAISKTIEDGCHNISNIDDCVSLNSDCRWSADVVYDELTSLCLECGIRENCNPNYCFWDEGSQECLADQDLAPDDGCGESCVSSGYTQIAFDVIGVQDDLEVCESEGGCLDPQACNYNSEADQDDGSCVYSEVDANGVECCADQIDCQGVCYGELVIDECGICGGENYCEYTVVGDWYFNVGNGFPDSCNYFGAFIVSLYEDGTFFDGVSYGSWLLEGSSITINIPDMATYLDGTVDGNQMGGSYIIEDGYYNSYCWDGVKIYEDLTVVSDKNYSGAALKDPVVRTVSSALNASRDCVFVVGPDADCAGECFGDAAVDACGVCDGPGEIYDCGCYDVPEGNCDCDGTTFIDCNNDCGGDAVYDDCGICGGSTEECFDPVALSIDNIVDNGNGALTFDVMIQNFEPVSGFQVELKSGNGVFDEQEMTGCGQYLNNPCFWDTGSDNTLNQYEDGHVSSINDEYCSDEEFNEYFLYENDDHCLAAGLQWNYYNPDPNFDNFEEWSECTFNYNDYNWGYCDIESYCYDVSDFSQVYDIQGYLATENNCYALGGVWIDCNDYENCIYGCMDYSDGSYGSWTDYDQGSCEESGGFWYGNQDGTEGNQSYDLGEAFLDANQFITLNEVEGGISDELEFLLQYNESNIIGFSLSGTSIPTHSSPVSLFSVQASYGVDDIGQIVFLDLNSICKRPGATGDHLCFSETIIADPSNESLAYSFEPAVWTLGEVTDIYGCMDPEAENYNPEVTIDDGTCSYLGDVTGDLVVDILDVVRVVAIIMQSYDPTDLEYSLSDLNGDTIVDILDIVMLVNIILDN